MNRLGIWNRSFVKKHTEIHVEALYNLHWQGNIQKKNSINIDLFKGPFSRSLSFTVILEHSGALSKVEMRRKSSQAISKESDKAKSVRSGKVYEFVGCRLIHPLGMFQVVAQSPPMGDGLQFCFKKFTKSEKKSSSL